MRANGSATQPYSATDVSTATTTIVQSSFPPFGREKTDSAITQYDETELGVISYMVVVLPYHHMDDCGRLYSMCSLESTSAPFVHRA